MFRRLAEPAATVGVTIDGRPFRAAEGDTVSALLLQAGVTAFRRASKSGLPRSAFCGMGVCFECLVTIDGAANRQACLVRVAEGMAIATGGGAPEVGR